MITRVISAPEAGRRLDRYLSRILPKMPDSFLRRQLRGNGFRLNDVRIHDGTRILCEGDTLAIYLTDEQLDSFGYQAPAGPDLHPVPHPPIVYEDDQIVIFDKPRGMLSQKDRTGRPSLSEIGAAYLYGQGLAVNAGFVPGICNRLDTNTCGLVMMGKTLAAQQTLMQMIREDRIQKTYLAVVAGHPDWPDWTPLVHRYRKDPRSNRMHLAAARDGDRDLMQSRIRLRAYFPNENRSMVEIALITGKSHQIRSQLQFEGFPIVGDPKYNPGTGSHQLLCAHELYFIQTSEPILHLQGRHFYAVLPQDMNTYLVEPK